MVDKVERNIENFIKQNEEALETLENVFKEAVKRRKVKGKDIENFGFLRRAFIQNISVAKRALESYRIKKEADNEVNKGKIVIEVLKRKYGFGLFSKTYYLICVKGKKTYYYRQKLKEMGYKWNAKRKEWQKEVRFDEYDEELEKLRKVLKYFELFEREDII